MKVLLANKFYYRRGGDCIYVLNLEQLLKANGHEVAIFAMDYPDNLQTVWSKYFPKEVKFKPGKGFFEAFMRPFGTKTVKDNFSRLLEDFKPDIVHINNIHSQISPIIVELAHKNGAKVVWTLHDYKLLCPRYDCLRNGKQVCEACFEDKKNVLRFFCLKNSKIASFIAYVEAKKWNRERLEKSTDLFICPSKFMYSKMVHGRFSSSKLKCLYNFIDTEKCKSDDFSKEDYYCYVGRLSNEKGVKTLMRAAIDLPYKLKIVGDGPLANELKNIAQKSNLKFLGHKPWEEIKNIVGKAKFVVTPSQWYENNPLSVIESLCLGTPVLGARIGGIPELIEENVNGLLFEPENVDNLKEKIEYCWSKFPKILNYKKIAESSCIKFSANSYYENIASLYNSL